MPNKNYQRGSSFERKVKKEYEARGYYVTKSGGSKGIADLTAVKKHESTLADYMSSEARIPEVIFIQCGEITPVKEDAIKRLAAVTGAKYEVRQIPPKRISDGVWKKKQAEHKDFKRRKVGLNVVDKRSE